MATLTPKLGLSKPIVGADDDVWGAMLNGNMDSIDSKLLPLAGGTMTGPIVLAGNATLPLHAVAFQQLTAAIAGLPANVSSFNTRTGAVTLTLADITGAGGAPLASPVFSGNPQSVTPPPGDNDTSIATTAFVAAAMAAAGGSVTIAATPPPVTDRGLWWDSTGGQLYVGFADVNSLAWVAATNPPGSASSYLPIAGGIMTGPITLAGNATLPLHAAAFQQIPLAASATSPMNGTAAVGVGTTWARVDHVHASDTSRAAQASLANYLLLTGGTLTGASGILTINSTGSDPLVINTSAGGNARFRANVGGQHTWSCGQLPTGEFNIADETAGRVPFSCLSGGLIINLAATAQINAPSGVNDPLSIATTAGTYARARYTVAGQRTWSCGQSPTGGFNIADETTPMTAISCAAGGMSVSIAGSLNLGGGISAGAGITGTLLTANNGNVQINKGPATNASIWLSEGATGTNNRMCLYFETATGRDYMLDTYSGACLFLDPGGTFHYQGGGGAAYKTGGGPWADSSDARIKTVEGDYTPGLEAVLALRPVRYRYKGNDTPTACLDRFDPDGKLEEKAGKSLPYPGSDHRLAAKAGRVFVGLVAQEAEAAFPGMVTKRAGFIDGKAVDDLRDLDPSELTYALINAVRTLAGRLDMLEGGA